MDVEDEDAGGFSNVASEDEGMEVPQSSTVDDSIASPDGKLEQEMEQDICSPDGLDSNMDEVGNEEINQGIVDEEFVGGRSQESDDDDMVTSSNTVGEDENINPELEGQSNDEQPSEIDDINNEGQDSITEHESDKGESQGENDSRRESEVEESVEEEIDNHGAVESASESDFAHNDSISDGADSRDSVRDKNVTFQNNDEENNISQSELDLTVQHSSEVDENSEALPVQSLTNEGAINSPDTVDDNELGKCDSKVDSVQSDNENVESKNVDDKLVDDDDDESSIENDDDERGSDDENFDTIGSSFDEDADAENKDSQCEDKSEEIIEGKEDQNLDDVHSPIDGEEQDHFALHDNIPGSPDDSVDQNSIPEQEENIGMVESEPKLFDKGDATGDDLVPQELAEKKQTTESSEKNSEVSDEEFEERNEDEGVIAEDDDREDISEEEDYNDDDALEENTDSLERFQNDCVTTGTGNSAGQSLPPDTHSDGASDDENDNELDLTKGAPDNMSVNVPRDSAESPDASNILEPSIVRKQESVEHEDIDSPESDIGGDMDDNPASPVSSEDGEADKEGIYNDVSDEEEVYSDDESNKDDVGAKNSENNANVSPDKPQQVVFIRKMSLDRDGFDTFKDPLQRSKLEMGTFKSQSSLPEDHVELDYDEDGMDDMAKDKEKMDDSRGDEEEEKREMEDGEQFSDKDDGEVEDDEDCEEGEIKEPGARKPFVKPICRFFTRGQCTWGNNCRFLHPGINDKGNYRLIERPGMDGGPRGFGGRPWQEEPPFEELPPPPAAPVPESAWERGLKQAKELLKKSSQRKELEPDFEVKKYNMSVEEDRDFNKENDRQKADKIVKDPYYDQVYDDEYYDKPHQQPHSWQPGQYENFEVHWTREPEEWIPPPPHRQPPPYMHERENYSPRHFSPPVERFHDRRREHRRPRQWEENREIEEYVPPRPKADQWHDPWRRSKSPKRKPRMSRSHSRGRRRARRSHSYSSSFSSSSFSGSSRSRSRSSSYSSLSSRSSFSRSSSGSSRSRSPHKSPVKKPPGDRKGPAPVSKVNNDQPRSAVAVKGKGPRSPDKRRHSAHHGHPGQRPGMPPKPGGPPGGPMPPHPSQRGRPPHRGMPPSRPKRRSGSESSSGSSGSRSHSSSSISSRSSSASSGSSISSHSSVSSSGSADSEHLYRGVGAKEAASGPQKRKGPVPRPKTAKRPGREHGGPPGPGGNRMHPRGGPGNKMERGGKPDPRGGPGGKLDDLRGGPGGKIDPRSGPGGQKLEQRGMKAGPGGGKPDSRGPGGLRGSKDGRHGPEANRQPPVQTKAKDPLKLSGQKPNIKLTLLNKQPTDKPPVAKKRPAEQNLTQPPAKRPTHPTAAPPKPQEKTLKKPEKVVRPPALKPKPTPVSPTKAPVRPPALSPTKAPPKPAASALAAAAAAAAQKEKKSTSSRREELLRQLKAVEDAIARKRSKMD